MGSLIIASKLEAESKEVLAGGSTSCRLAFYGPLVAALPAESALDAVRLFRWKQKECEVHRAVDIRQTDGMCFEAIGWKLFSKNASIRPFLGLKLEKDDGEVVGLIHGPFGSTDKFKIRFPNGVQGVTGGMKLRLRFKRYVFDTDKSMNQRGIDFPEATPVMDATYAPIDFDPSECTHQEAEPRKRDQNESVVPETGTKSRSVEAPEVKTVVATANGSAQSPRPATEQPVASSRAPVSVNVESLPRQVAAPSTSSGVVGGQQKNQSSQAALAAAAPAISNASAAATATSKPLNPAEELPCKSTDSAAAPGIYCITVSVHCVRLLIIHFPLCSSQSQVCPSGSPLSGHEEGCHKTLQINQAPIQFFHCRRSCSYHFHQN